MRESTQRLSPKLSVLTIINENVTFDIVPYMGNNMGLLQTAIR